MKTTNTAGPGQVAAMQGGAVWTDAPLCAIDLEGTGAQDHEDEAILEISLVPVTLGRPDTAAAYTTLINPGRPVPRRPWISPGLTDAVLATAPDPADVGPELDRRISGQFLVGHNVGVDWRLLHRRYPGITPAGLIDTMRLARHLSFTKKGLKDLVGELGLRAQIEQLAAGSQPHRALWDTVAAAVLLRALTARAWPEGATLTDLAGVAGIDLEPAGPASSRRAEVPAGALF
jgi:DNA polymerase III epsilon subunit-like protein